MRLTSKQVKDYMMWRTDEQFRQCPYAIADACNEVVEKFHGTFGDDNITAKDLMKLLFFNDPIPSLHTHSYGFNTATGRNIIQTLEIKYYEFINTK
tara:strand:+ start:75 stop:362 length:288 start_codon:yes stop_codon:yes gene_type:complete